VLPTTNIYAINLGEAEFTATSLQYLLDFLPSTTITQIYLHHHPHPQLLRRIHLSVNSNRPKVEALYASRGIIPAEWALISRKAATNITFTTDYVSSQSTTSTDHLDPHPPPSQDYDIAPASLVISPAAPVQYDPNWNRYPRNQRPPAAKITLPISSSSSSRNLQFRRSHNQVFPSQQLWSQEGYARAAVPASTRKRKLSEPQEDATSNAPLVISPTALSVMSLSDVPRDQIAQEHISRIDSPTCLRRVRLRSSTAFFDLAVFRTIFSSRNFPIPQDPSGLPLDFCLLSSRSCSFSFSFNFDAATTSTATTLPYDKHIVDS
jgi:hypothetical protein